MSPSDLTLAQRWMERRDGEAFQEIVRRHSAMVYATCRRILRNAADAEEIAQDCFLTLALAKSPVRTSLAGWLHTTATHRSINRIRTDSRRREREKRYDEIRETPEEIVWDDVSPLVDQAIAELPEKLREPIIACFLKGQTHAAIAGSTGISQSTITRRIKKGIERVRKSLKKRGVTIGATALAGMFAAIPVEAAPAALIAALGKMALAGAGATPTTVGTLATTKPIALIVAAAVLTLLLAGGAYKELVWDRISSQDSPNSKLTTNMIAKTNETQNPQTANSATGPSPFDPVETPASSAGPSHKTSATENENPEETPEEPDEQDTQLASISGIVVDDGGYPLPGATVTAPFGVSEYSAAADSTGRYSINSIPGHGTLTTYANADGYKTESKHIDLKPGHNLETVDFYMSKGFSLKGHVISTKGEPVPGAHVQHRGGISTSGHGTWPGGVTFTDKDGLFTLGFRDKGSIALKVTTKERTETMFTDIAVPGFVELRIPQRASLSGTVKWADGRPGSKVTVWLRSRFSMDGGSLEEPITISGTSTTQRKKTDVQGRYSFDDLVPNQLYVATIEHSWTGRALSQKYDLGVLAAGEAKVWDPVLESGMKVTGKVTGERTGKPLREIEIACFMEDGRRVDGTGMPGADLTNRRGSYELNLFEPGTYLIFPKNYGWPDEEMRDTYGKHVRWTPDEEVTVNFELPEYVTRSVRVIDIDQKPIEKAKVNLYTRLSEGASSNHGIGYTDKQGKYSWDRFTPLTESWFEIEKDGFLNVETDRIFGEPGEVYPADQIVLILSGGVEGRLINTDGTPVADTKITVTMTPDDSNIKENYVSFKTDSNGMFAVAQGLAATSGKLMFYSRTPYRPTSIEAECVAGSVINLGDITLVTKQ